MRLQCSDFQAIGIETYCCPDCHDCYGGELKTFYPQAKVQRFKSKISIHVCHYYHLKLGERITQDRTLIAHIVKEKRKRQREQARARQHELETQICADCKKQGFRYPLWKAEKDDRRLCISCWGDAVEPPQIVKEMRAKYGLDI